MITVVGCTASGKTALSLQIAQHFYGEIICADSRTVYRGMDIGTAKPDENQQKLVTHHCLDLVNPDESYNVLHFQNDAQAAIKDIRSRGKIPIIVGGTGLYINALIYNYKFPSGEHTEQRKVLESLSLEELITRLRRSDPDAVKRVDLANPRRVIRAIETAGQPSEMDHNLAPSHLLIGLNPGMEQLNKNIVQRTNEMIKDGLVNEALKIAKKYGNTIEPLNTVGYRESLLFDDGLLSPQQLIEQISIKTRQLAKRQMTWFKRDENIQWFANGEDVLRWLAKKFKETSSPN